MLEVSLKTTFQNAFSILGKNWEVNNDLFIILEQFVWQLYGYQNKSTDRVRFQTFMTRSTR